MFTWSLELWTAKTNATVAIASAIDCDDSYIYVGDYGLPLNGPNLYRSADGVTWETVVENIPETTCSCYKTRPF